MTNSNIMMVTWICKKFYELTPEELYVILQLRNEVFVVEQNCVYQDLDNKDQVALHLIGWDEKKLVAYSRLIPPGVSYPEPSIGRVVTSPSARRKGLGKELMQQSIFEVKKLFGDGPVKLGAQLYLKNFYSSFGFMQTSEIYLEDGIPHIEMVKPRFS
jgi:ElaA protein